jgi:sodium transport system ATP-binding protein
MPGPRACTWVLRSDRTGGRAAREETLIEARDLAKSFDARVESKRARVVAVEQVSFDAADGRITALLGPNGAGKTTTLRIVGTLVRADRGSARVGGIDVLAHPRSVRAQLGTLSDARGLYSRLTGRENVAYYAELRQVRQAEFDGRLAMLADLLDMRPLLDRRTEGFSTGERMKVALARALIHDPQHLMLDEPTNGLDVVSTRALRRLLLHLRDAGKCIVISSHIMQEVEQLADEIVIVAHGRTVARGSADAIRAQAGTASLEDAFVRLAYESGHVSRAEAEQ